ncbi:branched-chain amino acid aminotransferase [Polluticaenibacter yanchengensis]|uniref:Branched-chain-amino-acid aminotransferase n=1 Tax=Polluticaenibacter yanchengensis TaxID=3014562 RepID=A0ABT4UL89_9BACT|nr:branched-chain amino acid aminotransferase [Chitinophagaceae bacterium LY-5]
MANLNIKVTKINESKLSGLDWNNLPFGKNFSDHMFVADYINGEWTNLQIIPYQNISISPANAALHYGQSIFEGVKAYRLANGDAAIFRLEDNFKRFNRSAERLMMPKIPAEVFVEGTKQLVALDQDWIPNKENHSLYIRPFMFALDEVIGVKPSDSYKFMVLLSPTGPYYPKPMRIYVEEQYVRAVPGGVGYTKVAGNYASSLYAAKVAKDKGFDQVLWMDAIEHKYVQEMGTMNAFFIIGNKAITPGLEDGTILEGVTRNSVIQILKEMGLTVEERNLSIDEILEAYKSGELKEAFGTGTAATISRIQELVYEDFSMTFDCDKWEVSPEVTKRIDDIRYGRVDDRYNWLVTV